MATRGTISIENKDGTVQTVYSHWDNYLECNGKFLVENYNTREAVENSSLAGVFHPSVLTYQMKRCHLIEQIGIITPYIIHIAGNRFVLIPSALLMIM